MNTPNENQLASPVPEKQLAKASPKQKFQALVDSEHFKEQILMALPKHLTPERFIRVLMTATVKTPKLLECTTESLFHCIFNAAAAGLEIDGRRAALVPLTNRKKAGSPLEANLWPMYQGIAELIMRSGLVSNIHADLVCDKDDFEYDRGVLAKHKIDYRNDRGEPYAVYSIIRMKDGTEKVEVMSYAEVERIRKASPGADADAWRNNWGEMAKKTVFRRASKWVPLSAEIKNVLESEPEPEPVNVTPKPSLATLIGAPETRQTELAVSEMAAAEGVAAEQKANAEPPFPTTEVKP
jgi:recombination protein RecT